MSVKFRSRCSFLLLLILLPVFLASCATNRTGELRRAEALRNLGNALVADGKVRQGYAELQKAHKLDPKNPDLNQEIALACRDMGKYDLSIQYFNRALKYKSNFPEAWNNLGTVYLLMGKWDKAIFCFKDAANNLLYETPQFAYNNMGTAYFNKGDYENAIENYQLAIKTVGSYFMAYLNLARAYEARQDWDKALEAYKDANLSFPRDSGAHLLMARLLLRMDKKEDAIKELKLAVKYGGEGKGATEAQVMLRTLEGQ